MNRAYLLRSPVGITPNARSLQYASVPNVFAEGEFHHYDVVATVYPETHDYFGILFRKFGNRSALECASDKAGLGWYSERKEVAREKYRTDVGIRTMFF